MKHNQTSCYHLEEKDVEENMRNAKKNQMLYTCKIIQESDHIKEMIIHKLVLETMHKKKNGDNQPLLQPEMHYLICLPQSKQVVFFGATPMHQCSPSAKSW